MAEVFLFPAQRTVAWRVVESTALRVAGGAGTPQHRAVQAIAHAYSNVPPDLLAPVLDAVAAHVKTRIEEHQTRVGNTAFQYLPSPARVIALPRK